MKFEFPKKKMQKKRFSVLFFFQKRDDILFVKKIEKIENKCLIHFLQKIYFEMLNKKNDSVWNKKKMLKRIRC